MGGCVFTNRTQIVQNKYHQRELHADLETPVSAYLKLRGTDPWSFLLESVEGSDQWANYSILGFGARRLFVVQNGKITCTVNGKKNEHPAPDTLEALRQHAGLATHTHPHLPPVVGGIFGFLSYDASRPWARLAPSTGPAEVPDAVFFEPELLAVFNNRRYTLTLYAEEAAYIEHALQRLDGALPQHKAGSGWVEPTQLTTREAYKAAVTQGIEHIRAGDIIQVVLSRRFETPRIADPFDVYRGLRAINPSPYMYYFNTPRWQFAGASPEVMVRVAQGRMTVRPIAGTRPRGATPAEDTRLAQELLADEKERAEHIMLVDLGRNDVGRVAKTGSVRVSDLMHVEKYSHVMHLVSEVVGDVHPGADAFDAVRAAFPAGTLSGAPKVRAMQIIDALEHHFRGLYGGAVGYFAPGGNADFGIAIRTLMALPDRFVVQAGAGIVADSDPTTEADETEHKSQAVMRALRWAASRVDKW